MTEFSDIEISVIYDALQEQTDRERHEPYLFSDNERMTLGRLFARFHVEAKLRKVIHV